MITATVNTRELSLVVEGHAGFAEPGKDIVCAAVSALVNTLRCAWDAMEPVMVDEGDRVIVRCDPKLSKLQTAIEDLRVVRVGLLAVMRQYPDYVRVKNVD